MYKKGFPKTKIIATIDSIEINKFKGFDSIKIENLGRINAFFGKNNSGKSSILHAIEFAILPSKNRSWEERKAMLDPEIVITDKKNFSIKLNCKDDFPLTVRSTDDYEVKFDPDHNSINKKLNSILIWPDPSILQRRGRHITPKNVWVSMQARDFSQASGLEMFYTIQFYGSKSRFNLKPDSYKEIETEIKRYFLEIKEIYPSRTEEDIDTVSYKEYGGRTMELVYSGTGMRHFLDIIIKAKISKANIILLDEPEMGLHPDQQRKLIEYLDRFSRESNVQIFMATHSPVMLTFADKINYYKVHNRKGNRSVVPVPKDSIHTLMSDIGIKPSDYFNMDICLMVEGQTDVIFFEHIIRTFYKKEFKNIHIGVIQYGGSAADGIIKNKIDISNLVSAQKYTFWIRDRDSKPTDDPYSNSKKFCNKIKKAKHKCHILKKREIEYYFPDNVLIHAQQGNIRNEQKILAIKNGDQSKKFSDLADGLCVPEGKNLKKLLKEHMTKKSHIENEIKNILKIPTNWSKEING
jgi:predicted ATP-dependent endonuclease of OLD family